MITSASKQDSPDYLNKTILQRPQHLGTRNDLEAGLRQVVQQLVVADLGVAVDRRRPEKKIANCKIVGVLEVSG